MLEWEADDRSTTDLASRVDALFAQVSTVRAELAASKSQRRLLVEALRTVSEQLRILSEMDDLSEMERFLDLQAPSSLAPALADRRTTTTRRG